MELLRIPLPTSAPAPSLAPAVGDLSAVWFSLDASPWKALLLVPAGAGEVSSVAAALMEVAVRASPTPPLLVDGRGLTPEGVRLRLAELEAAELEERRAIVLIDSPLQCPPAQALARRCDAALLCVELGETSLEAARQTLALCGRERFRGAVVMREGRDR